MELPWLTLMKTWHYPTFGYPRRLHPDVASQYLRSAKYEYGKFIGWFCIEV